MFSQDRSNVLARRVPVRENRIEEDLETQSVLPTMLNGIQGESKEFESRKLEQSTSYLGCIGTEIDIDGFDARRS
jgi:hypothetical protein